MITTCLCCGEQYDSQIEGCPSRYLSPHSVDFALVVARVLLDAGVEHPSHPQLLRAIEAARGA